MATFYNQAKLVYNGNTSVSNIVSGEIIDVLSITKNAVKKTYENNDIVTYVISIVNQGSTPYNNLILTDDLGTYLYNQLELTPLTYVENSILYYINGVQKTNVDVKFTDKNIIIYNIDVPANSDVTIVYQVQTNRFAPLNIDNTITNTAILTGDAIANEILAKETITAENTALLTINKSITPATVAGNGKLTYTFVIENMGNQAITEDDRVVFSDVFNPILKNISVTFNNTTWEADTNYSYDTATGEFTTNDNQITVPSAAYTQDIDTGQWSIDSGTSVLVISGTI